MTPLYFEDIETGQTYTSHAITVLQEEIIDFATRFDPQPQHIDPVAATASLFGELVASGWHTGALTMRLQTDAFLCRFPGGAVGAQVDSLAWPRPVRPGDVLRAQVDILDRRESRSRPSRGVVHVRTTTLNQRDEAVQLMTATILVPRRPA